MVGTKVWTTSKTEVKIQPIIFAIIWVASLFLLITASELLSPTDKVLLIVCPILTCLFLFIVVQYIEIKQNEFKIKTVFETKYLTYENIESIEIKEERNVSYMIIRLKKPLYIRKSISFRGIDKNSEVFKFLKEKTKSR